MIERHYIMDAHAPPLWPYSLPYISPYHSQLTSLYVLIPYPLYPKAPLSIISLIYPILVLLPIPNHSVALYYN